MFTISRTQNLFFKNIKSTLTITAIKERMKSTVDIPCHFNHQFKYVSSLLPMELHYLPQHPVTVVTVI